MIAAGKYTAVATGTFDLGTADTGTEQIAVEFELLDGEAAGQCMVWYGYFTEKTTDRTIQALRYAGWQGDDIATLEGLGSRRVTLVVEHDTGTDGKVRPKIAWVNRYGSAGVTLKKPMDDKARRMFAAKMKSLAKAQAPLPPEDELVRQRGTNGRSNGAAVPPGDEPPPHGDEDDPIPF